MIILEKTEFVRMKDECQVVILLYIIGQFQLLNIFCI